MNKTDNEIIKALAKEYEYNHEYTDPFNTARPPDIYEAGLRKGFEAAIKERAKENQKIKDDLETEIIRLAACGVAAMCNTVESIKKQRVGKDSPYWSASYSNVCDVVDREMKMREAHKKISTLLPAKEGFDGRLGGMTMIGDISRKALREK